MNALHRTRSRKSEPRDREERLRRENWELRRQLEAVKGAGHGGAAAANLWHPSSTTIWAIFLAAVVLVAIAFFAGYIPLQKRRAVIAWRGPRGAGKPCRASKSSRSAAPPARAACNCPATSSPSPKPRFWLAPTATSSAIGRHRRSREGRPNAGRNRCARIDRSGRPSQSHRPAGPGRAPAGHRERPARQNRYGARARDGAPFGATGGQGRGVKQDDDQAQAQYNSKLAALQSLEKAIDVQRANIIAAQSNLARLQKCKAIAWSRRRSTA